MNLDFFIGLVFLLIGGINLYFIIDLFGFLGGMISQIGFFFGIYLCLNSFLNPNILDNSYFAEISQYNTVKSLRYEIYLTLLEEGRPLNATFGFPMIKTPILGLIGFLMYWNVFSSIRVILGMIFPPGLWWRGIISLFFLGILYFLLFRVLIHMDWHVNFYGFEILNKKKSISHIISDKHLFQQLFARFDKIPFEDEHEKEILKHRYFLSIGTAIAGILYFLLTLLL